VMLFVMPLVIELVRVARAQCSGRGADAVLAARPLGWLGAPICWQPGLPRVAGLGTPAMLGWDAADLQRTDVAWNQFCCRSTITVDQQTLFAHTVFEQ
jgi:hypothetical protein